jgi:hypothetical protein
MAKPADVAGALMAADGVTLFIDPPSHHFLKDKLFEANAVPFAGDQLMAPYTNLRRVLSDHGITARTIDALPETPLPGRHVYISTGGLERYDALARRPDLVISAFFAFECPGVDPRLYRALPRASRVFRRMFTWSDGPSLRPFVGADLPFQRFCWPQSFDDVHESIWTNRDRRFLVMMQANKIPVLKWGSLQDERLKAVEYFARTGDIDLYGREWDQPPHRVGYLWIPYTLRLAERRLRGAVERVFPDPLMRAARSAWRGPAASKSAVLGQYTFAICFENMILKGWITEKIFDCFFCGTIPIYWGAPEIRDVIPADCYIDMREFADYAALGRFLRALSPAAIDRYREAARAYLASPAYQPFTKAAFAELILRIVQEDAALPAGQALP